MKKQVDKSISWLLNSQTAGDDDGYASHFELGYGWHASYPEVTGYIIPTLLKRYRVTGEKNLLRSSLSAANWLLSIQNPTGSFHGRLADENTPTPVVFNTGMIIFGLLSAYDETGNGRYLRSAKDAGDWLVSIQHPDGTWPEFNTINGDCLHDYHTRVAWAMLELYSRTSSEKYLSASLSNLNYCISNQGENGWFSSTGLTKANQEKPLLHFISYTIRGILECGLMLNSSKLINSAIVASTAIYDSYVSRESLFARYDPNWMPTEDWQCLTGNFQVSIIFKRLSRVDSSRDWSNAAKDILLDTCELAVSNQSVPESIGSVAGSFPLGEKYMPECFLSWATKFFIDSFYEIEKDNLNEV